MCYPERMPMLPICGSIGPPSPEDTAARATARPASAREFVPPFTLAIAPPGPLWLQHLLRFEHTIHGRVHVLDLLIRLGLGTLQVLDYRRTVVGAAPDFD